jgi:hypothetical protein
MLICVRAAILILMLVFTVSGQEIYPFTGRDITLTPKLSHPNDTTSTQLAKDFHLGFTKIDVNAGADFRSILRKNRIVPNGDALGLIYDLNPSIYDLSSVQPGKIPVPAIVGADTLTANASKFLFEIRTDAALKDELLASIELIQSLTKKLQDVNDSYFGTPQTTASIKEETRTLSDSLDDIASAISEKFIPFPHEVVMQLHFEVQVLQDILKSMLAGPMSVDSLIQTRLSALSDDFDIKKRAFGETRGDSIPARWPSVSVVVKTAKKGHVEVQDYRIHYVPPALKDVPESEKKFGQLSSPTKAVLPEANYIIWATSPEDSKQVSDDLVIKVRDDGSDQSYELRIHE